MVQKVTPSLPSRLYSTVVPQNRIVQVALGILALVVVVRVFQSLKNRIIPSASSPNHIRNTAAQQYFDIGCTQREANNFHAAFHSFEQAYQLNPTHPALRANICNHLGSILLRSKKYVQAEEKFDEVLTLDLPDNNLAVIYAHTQKGVIAEWQKDFPKALHHYDEVIKVEPEFEIKAAYQLKKSSVQIKQNDLNRAWDTTTQALEGRGISERLCGMLIQIAQLLAAKKELTEAHRYADKALDCRPESNTSLLGSFHYAKAIICEAEGKFQESWDHLSMVLQHVPVHLNRGDILFNRAMLRLKLAKEEGKYVEAADDLSEALTYVPAQQNDLRAQVLINRADIYLKMKGYDLAKQDLEAAQRCESSEERVRTWIAQELEKLAANPAELKRLAREAWEDNDLQRAIGLYSRLIDGADLKDRREAFINRGVLRVLHKQYDLALEDYLAALTCEPTAQEIAGIQLRISLVLVKQLQHDQALEKAQAAVASFKAKDEEICELLLNLSEESLETHKVQQAQLYTTTALEYLPEGNHSLHSAILYYQARSLFELKDYQSSLDKLEEALAFVDSDNKMSQATIHYWKGKVYEAMGNKESAKVCYQKAEQLRQELRA